MPSKSLTENASGSNSHAIPPSAVCSEQWWQAAGYYPFSLTEAGGNAPGDTLLGHPAGMARSKNDHSSSSGEDDDDEETSKDSETTGSNSTHRDVTSRQEPQQSQSCDSMPLGSAECFPQHPQMELVGHSVACASTPYPDLYYGGMMAAYGPQPLVPPQFYGMHQPRMPLPLELAQEPVYVNAKQYRGILRRRQVRAKAELEKKLIKVRKPYLHESRHQHALRRARGSGGRFAKKSEAEAASSRSTEDKSKTSDVGASQSHETHHGEQQKNDPRVLGEARSGEGRSNPQWGSLSSDQAQRRALAI